MKIAEILGSSNAKNVLKSESLYVRELDQEHKGFYVSYVDQDESTFDVSVQVNRNQVTGHNCDCDSNQGYCAHVLAVLQAIQGTKPSRKTNVVKPRAPRAKKLSESELVMLNLDKEALIGWAQRVFKSNKDLELQFMLEFGAQEVKFSCKDVELLIHDAVNSVIGKRKKIDAREVKKVADLVSQSLEGVKEYVLIHSHQEIALDISSQVYNSVVDFKQRVVFNSIRMDRVVQGFVEYLSIAISQIKSSEDFMFIISKLWDRVFKTKESQTYQSDFYLLSHLYSCLNQKQQGIVSNKVIEYLNLNSNSFDKEQIQVKSFFLDVLIQAGLLSQYKHFFAPVKFYNDYNMKLLKALLDVDQELMKEYALLIIEHNVDAKYDLPYYELLKDYYLQNNNIGEVVKYLKLLFLSSRSLSDYKYILEHDTPKEFKKFRKSLFYHLESQFHKKKKSEDLIFALLDQEKNYQDMLEYVDFYIRFSIFYPYLKQMFLFDSQYLLSRLFRIGKYGGFGQVVDQPSLEFVLEHYTKDELLEALKVETIGEGSFNEAVLLRLSLS